VAEPQFRRHDVPSPARAQIAAMLRALPAARDQTLEQKRADIEAVASHGLDALGVERHRQELPVAAEWLLVPGREHDMVTVYLHGGGFVVCSVASHRDRAGRIALAAGGDGLIVEYDLAPDHPFPHAIDQAVAVCRTLADEGRPFALAGDSAGGGLVMSTMLALRDAGATLPVAAVAISPWVDLTLSAESLTTRRAIDPFAHLDDLPACVDAYLAGVDPSDPYASPLFADLRGLPPLLVQVGSDETLYDDAERLARRAAEAGVSVELEEWVGMFHTWQAYAGELEAADESLAHAGRFLRRHVATDSVENARS
jgi:acetyl esterase/lipase